MREALPAGAVRELYLTPEAGERHADVMAAAAAASVRPRWCTEQVLAAMCDTVTPQGLLAVCVPVDVTLAAALARRPRLVAVLAHVRDPGNAGTVLRAADAAGADLVVLTDQSVDVHNPKCVRSTAGSLFHLDVVVGVPLAAVVTELRAAGCAILAADGAGEHDLDELQDAADLGGGPLAGPVAWVFGNEAWGLPTPDQALCDAVVRVPVHGRAESLNLATAATVCLYAAARAHRTQRVRDGEIDGFGACARNAPGGSG